MTDTRQRNEATEEHGVYWVLRAAVLSIIIMHHALSLLLVRGTLHPSLCKVVHCDDAARVLTTVAFLMNKLRPPGGG